MNKEKASIVDTFMIGPPIYDLTPPIPQSSAKLFHYSLDPNRHSEHRWLPTFLVACKPLLIGCDLGYPVEEMLLHVDQLQTSANRELSPEDEALIRECLPNEAREM